MSSMLATLLTVLVLAIVHLYAGTTAALGHQWRPRALSAASGVSVAYVFLDLLPDLAEQQSLIDRAGLFPGLDRHIYILALVGLTVSLWVETASRESRRRRRVMGEPDQTGIAAFWLSIISFMVLNAAIGYAVASPGDQAVEPLWMFAVAMGLHFLANDHEHPAPRASRHRPVERCRRICHSGRGVRRAAAFPVAGVDAYL